MSDLAVPASVPAAPPTWGRERTIGQLFSASWGMFAAHKRWVIPLAVTCTVPGAAWKIFYEEILGYRGESFAKALGLNPHGIGDYGDAPSVAGFMGVWSVSILLMSLTTLFLHAAIYGTLTEAGRGQPVSLGLAFEQGARRFGTMFVTGFWLGLRLIPWVLLFFVPGIIKSYAWAFAIPARMAGDAPSSEGAIELSAYATNGRKGYLFAYGILMGLLIGGGAFIFGFFGGIFQALHWSVAAHAANLILALVSGCLGVAIQFGMWLAYADAVATHNPESPAAPYALGVSGHPYPVPQFRKV